MTSQMGASFELDPDPLVTGRLLLGSVLHGRDVSVEITEVEAYLGETDPASHAYKGPTARNAVMFGPPGHLYTYTMHGHTCANVVCSPAGEARAVLVRAGRVIDGESLAEGRRTRHGRFLARGPGNLTRALGITMADGGTALFEPHSPVRLELRPGDVAEPPISAGPRVGVPRAVDDPYRFWITGDPSVSAYRRAASAPARKRGGSHPL